MNEEFDAMFGPGTDLVVSLFAVALILIGILSNLYFDSMNSLILAQKKINTFETIFGKEYVDDILDNYETIEKEDKKSANQLTTPQLRQGHQNTPIPKRSAEGKIVHRLYAKGDPKQYKLYIKLFKSKIRIPVSNRTAHKIFKNAQNRYGSNLYIAVLVPDTFPIKVKKKLECEFWQYDYYQYFDQSYCRDYR
jgi:hypothetical protein